jgi:Zn-finger nucleic acid-binding protein
MNCPVCKVALTLAERNGAEIDYCPQCRGVWLDRGELDKLIERASAQMPARREQYETHGRYEGEFAHDDDDDYARGHHKRKRKSFLGEMFDFD